MFASSVLTESRLDQASRLIHLIAYPFLFGFLLDLSWYIQAMISVVFLLATLITRDFADAILSLWQAIAIAGLIFLLLDYLSEITLNKSLCALSIPIVWVGILLFKRKYSGDAVKGSSDRLIPEIVGVLGTGLLFFVVPRGQIQNLSFVGSGEDSALYMQASSNLLRGQDLQLVTGFGASSYLYFFNFLNNGFLYISNLSTDSEISSLLIALNVLSNAWIFVLVSSIFFSIRIVSEVRNKIFSNPSSFGFYALISLSSFLFFRASQGVGHFTQYLLNCVVLVFLLSLIETYRRHSNWSKIGYVGFSFATALSLVGSYGPWLPLTIIGVVLTINAFFDHSLIRKVLISKYLFEVIIFFVIGWIYMLRKLYAISNLEMGGGVSVIPLEAVWLVLVITLFFLKSLFVQRFRKTISPARKIVQSSNGEKTISFISAVVISVAILDRTSFNQLSILSFVILIGLLFRPGSALTFLSNFVSLTTFKEFDGILIMAFFSFFYSLSIYALSRFIGPIYDPMYAANKSMFTVFGQFTWLLFLIILCGPNMELNFSGVTRLSAIIVSMFLVLGITNFLHYDETEEQWWHEASLVALNENPDALVACVNPVLTRDYETYKCNHFMNTLTNHSYSARALMGVSLGDSPVTTLITDWFNGIEQENVINFEDDTKVIVLSQDVLTAGALGLFEGVAENMIEFRIVSLKNDS